MDCPTGPNQPKSQFLFHKKSQPQNFLRKTLRRSGETAPMISPPNDRWVRQIANLVGTLGKIDLGGSFICTSYDSFRSYGTKGQLISEQISGVLNFP